MPKIDRKIPLTVPSDDASVPTAPSSQPASAPVAKSSTSAACTPGSTFTEAAPSEAATAGGSTVMRGLSAGASKYVKHLVVEELDKLTDYIKKATPLDELFVHAKQSSMFKFSNERSAIAAVEAAASKLKGVSASEIRSAAMQGVKHVGLLSKVVPFLNVGAAGLSAVQFNEVEHDPKSTQLEKWAARVSLGASTIAGGLSVASATTVVAPPVAAGAAVASAVVGGVAVAADAALLASRHGRATLQWIGDLFSNFARA